MWALCSSSSFSDTVNGITNNAITDGQLSWVMQDVIQRNGGVVINNVFYRYTIQKEVEAKASVTVRNEDNRGGYVFSETDNWDGLRGSTINKVVPLPDVPLANFGLGEMLVEGEAEVIDASLFYSYKEDMCFDPLFSPSCPGYKDAMLDWLLANGYLDAEAEVDDSLIDELIEERNKEQAESSEEAETEEEEREEEEQEDELSIGGEALKIANAAVQAAQLKALANVAILDNYYAVELSGGTYTDAVVMKDSELQDNRRALRNFASQRLHEEMVDQQYNR